MINKPMTLAKSIRTAQIAHMTLRTREPGATRNEDSLMTYRTFVSAIERIRIAAGRAPTRDEVERVIARLMDDADLYSGRNPKAPGIPKSSDVVQVYALLQHAVGEIDLHIRGQANGGKLGEHVSL